MSKTTTVVLDSEELPHVKKRDKGARRAFVVVLAGDRMGEMFPLNDGRTSIGRGLHADVRINDEGISRSHAQVELDEGNYYLSDAGSTNGTFANGDRVDRYPLKEGDKIQIGASSVLKFTYHDDIDEDFQRSLYESALRDRLTGVFNRGYFNNRLESDVAFALRTASRSRWSSSTSTTSRPSTTTSATLPATRSCATSPSGSKARPAPRTSSPATAARSSC